MPKTRTSFEDHMNIVTGSHEKTASAKGVTTSLLDKLAAEMSGGKTGEVEEPARTAIPAEATVAEAAAAVVKATEDIAVPQTTIAGGNEAEKEKGMQSPPSKPAAIIIGDGDKKVTDSLNFSKEPAAVAEAAKDSGGEKTSSDKEAEDIGRKMAHSYVAEMRKIAVDDQYSQAVGILKEAGLLDKYTLDETLEKKASEVTSGLDKIANSLPLTKEDMVNAASEYVELSKQAEEADAYGREQAQIYFKQLVKQAEEDITKEAKKGKKDMKEEKEEAAEEAAEAAEETKEASDAAIARAVEVLVKAGVVKPE